MRVREHFHHSFNSGYNKLRIEHTEQGNLGYKIHCRFKTIKGGGILSLVVFISMVSAFAVNGFLFHFATTHAAGRQPTSVTKGILTPAESVDVSNSTNSLLSRGAKHLQQKKSQAKSPAVAS